MQSTHCWIVTQASHDGKTAEVVAHRLTQEDAEETANHVWNGGFEGPVPIAMYPIGKVFPLVD